MDRRLASVLCVVLLAATACSKDSKTTTSGNAADKNAVTIQVDNRSDAFNFESTSYFPSELKVAQGTTLKFHSNFQGEAHTVTLGSSIDKIFGIYDKLTPEQQNANGPPPPEVQALKIPFVVPDGADFSDVSKVKFNQSAAQPCVVAAGAFAPASDPCPTKKADAFDGSQTFFNSGLLKNDATFEVHLADNLAPGTYQWLCLFHGPQMRGKVTVVPKGDATAQSPAAVAAAGKKALADAVAKVQPEIDKAKAAAKAGEVKAGVSPENSPSGAVEFLPKEVSVPVGGSVTWNLSFHTVSFNAPEDARHDVLQDADGTWHFNVKTFAPVGYTPPAPKAGAGSSGGSSGSGSPPALKVDGGTFDGAGYYSTGSVDSQGDVLFTLKFSKAGTYKYICLIHPDMEGTVKVG